MNEHSHKVTAAAGLTVASVASFAFIAISAPAVHAEPYSNVPVFTAASETVHAEHSDDVHTDSAYEAPELPPAPYGTARTAVVHALPVRQPHAGGAAPTLAVPRVDLSLPWWLSAALRNAPPDAIR